MTEEKSTTSEHGFGEPGKIPEGFVYRDQKKRYPWWVKSTDRITVEVDTSKIEKPTTHMIQMAIIRRLQNPEASAGQRPSIIANIKKQAPGFTLPDVSMVSASQTFFQAGISIDGGIINEWRQIRELISGQVHNPEDLGTEPWQGSEIEASYMIEKAARHLSAAQIGFTALDLTWVRPGVEISSDVELPSFMEGKVLIPEAFKYIILVAGRVPLMAAANAPGALGSAADRTGYEEAHMAEEKLMNFIRGIGYKAVDIQFFNINPVPFAIMAGMGEMGRTNRVISPYFGGGIRFAMILTDLPLALDKPIDFGLQEFCRGCKKCARACPVGAISSDDDPSWEPMGPYSSTGKRVYYEDCEKCSAYTSSKGSYCGVCLASCPWNKLDETALHKIIRPLSAKLPSLSRYYAWFDDLFGYGLAAPDERKDWWEMPQKGAALAKE
ncbi:MAG: reductive dehalogenase [Deltaproteobacteria bacterium]|nr:reductive dehalogenase [Deltaproteobacteria bacterium]